MVPQRHRNGAPLEGALGNEQIAAACNHGARLGNTWQVEMGDGGAWAEPCSVEGGDLRARDHVERNVESTGDLNQSRFVGFDVGGGDHSDAAWIQTGIGKCDTQCSVQLVDRRPPPTSDPHRQTGGR